MSRIIRVVLAVAVVAVVAGGVLYWRGIIGHPAAKTASAAAPGAKAPNAKPKAPQKPFVVPSGAPVIGADLDAAAIDPFDLRLSKVNEMAHKMIVTNAEYHDSDGGTRYFVAIVTSCKDLNALWPIDKGVLASKVEEPLHLKSDFTTFSFVEYFQQGQWGVQSCEGVT
jgi:Flp pilus assembly protein CpaB